MRDGHLRCYHRHGKNYISVGNIIYRKKTASPYLTFGMSFGMICTHIFHILELNVFHMGICDVDHMENITRRAQSDE